MKLIEQWIKQGIYGDCQYGNCHIDAHLLNFAPHCRLALRHEAQQVGLDTVVGLRKLSTNLRYLKYNHLGNYITIYEKNLVYLRPAP